MLALQRYGHLPEEVARTRKRMFYGIRSSSVARSFAPWMPRFCSYSSYPVRFRLTNTKVPPATTAITATIAPMISKVEMLLEGEVDCGGGACGTEEVDCELEDVELGVNTIAI